MCQSLPPHDGEVVPDKISFRQRLSQYVRHLIVRGRSVHDDFLMLNILTEMVECLVDMFCALTHFQQASEFQCCTVVFENGTMHFGGMSLTFSPLSRASFRMPIKGMTSLRLIDSAMYSASVVDRAVIVFILDAQVMGAPAC